MVQALDPKTIEQLQHLRGDELLPSISRWTSLTGLFLVGTIGMAVATASITRYNVAIKANAIVRPSGELKVVQSELEGKVEQILVKENQPVQQGEAIATLDNSKLQIQRTQIQSSIQQNQLQLSQLDAQVRLMDMQILAESQSTDRSVAGAQADFIRSQREYTERQIAAEADFREAEVLLARAQEELNRHRPLAEVGAIAQTTLVEKETAVQTAEIRLQRARAALNPSRASITSAEQNVALQAARGDAALANLRKEREALIQRRSELQAQLLREQKELQKVEQDLNSSMIYATSDGVVFELNLTNTNQMVRSGDTIARIAPQDAPLVLRVQVANQDIDKVAVGQKAQVRIDACPYPDYGVLKAQVTAIAPDAESNDGNQTDGQSENTRNKGGDRRFEVLIQPDNPVLVGKNRECRIQPGMQGNASIISRQETLLQFLLRKARILTDL